MRKLGLCVGACLAIWAVAAAGEAAPIDVRGAFPAIVAEELRDAVPRKRDRAAVRLEGRVVLLDRVRTARSAIVRCEVSFFVMEMPGGSLRAILKGRAEISGALDDSLEERALRRAVRRALRPLRGGLPRVRR